MQCDGCGVCAVWCGSDRSSMAMWQSVLHEGEVDAAGKVCDSRVRYNG